MSKINVSRNTFLEKEELNRLMKFITDDSVKALVGNSVRSGGIVPPDGTTVGDNFALEEGTNHRYVKFLQDSTAYDTQGNRIFYDFEPSKEILLPYTPSSTEEIWLAVEYGTSKIEKGTVTVGANGTVIGDGTEFTKLFRGVSTLVPNKIRIYERTKISTEGDGYSYSEVGTYEVTQTVNDNQLLINTSTLITGGDYVFSVVGAFSPGTYDDVREEEIYEYDYYNLLFYTSEPTLTADQYILAKITVDDSLGTQIIDDLREDIFTLVDPLILDRISWSFAAMKGDWESLIISGCKSSLNYSGSTKISLNVPSGYVMLGQTIYVVDSHTSTIASPSSELPYWETYDDAGTTKARVVYSTTKLSTYYNFSQNYRQYDRQYYGIFNSGFAVESECGYLEGKITFTYDSTGLYVIKINGNSIIESAISSPPNKTLSYIFSTNKRDTSQRTNFVISNLSGSTANVVMLAVYNQTTGALQDLTTGLFEISIKKIDKENY